MLITNEDNIELMAKNKMLNDLMIKAEKYQKRYIEAERLLDKIEQLPWYKKTFCGSKIRKYFEQYYLKLKW